MTMNSKKYMSADFFFFFRFGLHNLTFNDMFSAAHHQHAF